MIGHLLNRTASVIRASSYSADEQGGWTPSNSEVTSIACRVVPASGQDLEMARRREAEVSHACYVAAGTDLRIGDSLTADGITYDVVVPDLAPSDRSHHLKVLLRERQTGE